MKYEKFNKINIFESTSLNKAHLNQMKRKWKTITKNNIK
jgi:hypothetical protein